MKKILLIIVLALSAYITQAQSVATLDYKQLYATTTNESVNSVDLSYPGYIISAQKFTDAWLPYYDNGFQSALRRFPLSTPSSSTNIIFGSTGFDEGVDMKYKNGYLYAIGHFTGTVQFHNGVGAPVTRSSGPTKAIYLTKYSTDVPSANVFTQVIKNNTSTAELTIKDFFIDDSGDVYVTGNYYGDANFSNGDPLYNRTASTQGSIFFAKYSGVDGSPIWIKGLDFYQAPPSGAYFSSNSIALDADGNVYIAGRLCLRVDMDPGPGIEDISLVSSGDFFISKYDNDGNYIDHVRIESNNNGNEVYDMKIKNGAIYVTGKYNGSNFDLDPSINYEIPTYDSLGNMFVAKYDLNFYYIWHNHIISNGDIYGKRIDVDDYGNVYVASQVSYNTNMNPQGTGIIYTLGGTVNVGITAYNTSGLLQWAKLLGSGCYVNGFAMTSDGQKMIIAGYHVGTTNFNLEGGTDNVTSNAYSQDGYIAVYSLDNPLAVNFESFTAEKQLTSAHLQWTTGAEQNNLGFDIEHSIDGKEWKKIGFQNSKAEEGNSNVTINYEFTDYKPKIGYNFYRIKQISYNGAITYSDVKTVIFDNIYFFSVSPNPANNTLNIDAFEVGKINIIDIYGKILFSRNLLKGKNTIDITQLSNGLYYIQNEKGETVKFIKK